MPLEKNRNTQLATAHLLNEGARFHEATPEQQEIPKQLLLAMRAVVPPEEWDTMEQSLTDGYNARLQRWAENPEKVVDWVAREVEGYKAIRRDRLVTATCNAAAAIGTAAVYFLSRFWG